MQRKRNETVTVLLHQTQPSCTPTLDALVQATSIPETRQLTGRALRNLGPRMDRVAEMIDDVSTGDKTLFIVDQTEGEQTLEYFLHSSKYVVLDAEKLNMKRTVKKQGIPSILEECRFQLTFAMKYGKVLVIRFGNSMTDFKFTFCDEQCPDLDKFQKHNPKQRASFLPRGFMIRSGEDLKTEEIVRALYRRDDIVELIQDLGEDEEDVDFKDFVPVCHPDFKVVMTTSMPIEKLEDFHFHAKYGLPETREFFDVRPFSLGDLISQGESEV